MGITIKTEEQIQKMYKAGQVVKQAHDAIEKAIKPGVTTLELDKIAEDVILSSSAIPSFKGYRGYPANICASVNEEVIHGIPGLRKLNSGDIISIDIGAFLDGYHGDAARTHAVGKITPEDQTLIDVTKDSFFEGIKFAKAGCYLHEISAAIQNYAESRGFGIVKDFVGHGIGTQMHEDPQIPNYKPPGRGPRLEKNMVLAIEPMVNAGTWRVTILADGWTVITNDKKNSAHYENTVLITDGEPQLLTI